MKLSLFYTLWFVQLATIYIKYQICILLENFIVNNSQETQSDNEI